MEVKMSIVNTYLGLTISVASFTCTKAEIFWSNIGQDNFA